MSRNTMAIDETEFPLSAGNPFEFVGIHSGGDLAGVELDITVYADADFQTIEELLKKDIVTVEDPFAGRKYEATLHRTTSVYTEGRRKRT